jgi:hypothetical protein
MSNWESRHPRADIMKDSHERKYEIAPDGNFDSAIENVLRDIKAAHDLRIPFTVMTVQSKGFRGGGNVDKADVFTYVVTIGQMMKEQP